MGSLAGSSRRYYLLFLIGAVLLASTLLSGSSAVSAASPGWTTTSAYPGANGSIGEQMCTDATGYVYCVGGIGGNDLAVDSSYYAQLSPSGGISGGWQQTTSYPPEGISSGSCVTYGGHIDCFGGWCTDSGGGPCELIQGPNNLDWYAPASSSGIGTWQQDSQDYPSIFVKTSLGTAPIAGDAFESCAQYNGWVYCVGGLTEVVVVIQGTTTTEVVPTATVVYAQLSPSGGIEGTWQYSHSYGAGTVFDTSCVAANGYLYCVGGDVDSNPGVGLAGGTISAYSTAPSSEVWAAPINSDGSLGAWSQGSDYGGGNADGLGCTTNGGFVFCTGNNSDKTWYAPIDGTSVGSWGSSGSYPTTTYDPTCLSNGDYIYCVGGNTNDVASELVSVTVEDQSSCQLIGGTWSNSPKPTCTIESGGTVTLALSGGTTLVVNGLLFVDGSITVGSSGALALGPSGLIYNYGTITVDSGGALYNNQGTMNNEPSANIIDDGAFSNYQTVQNSGTITVSSSTPFNNYGTLDNLGGSLNALLSTVDNAGTLQNEGTIAVTVSDFSNSGTYYGNGGMSLTIGSMTNSGSFTLNSGGQTLLLGNSGPDGSTLTNTGTITNFADITVDPSSAVHNNAGATVSNGGAITVDSGGTLTNSGTFDDGVPSQGSGDVLNYGTLNNYGTFAIDQGQLTNQAGATLTNEAGGVVSNPYNNEYSQADVSYNEIYNGGSFTNAGTLNVGSDFANRGSFSNAGSGTLVLTVDYPTCGSYPFAGSWTWGTNQGGVCQSGGAISLLAGLDVTIPAGTTFSNQGSLNVGDGATINVLGGLDNAPGGDILVSLSGTITASGVVENQGSINNLGTVSAGSASFSNSGAVDNYCGAVLTAALSAGSNPVDQYVCTVKLTPASGVTGDAISVSAQGFSPYDTGVTLSLGGTQVGPAFCYFLVPGSGTLTLCSFVVPQLPPGIYTLTAKGDAGDYGATQFTIPLATPALSTAVYPSTVAVGGAASDAATISGGNDPTGTITFTAFSDSACSTEVFSSTASVNGDGVYTSVQFTPSAAIAYYWEASYSGDANNQATAPTCRAPGETLQVTQASSSTSTQVLDQATGSPPSGTEVAGTVFFDTATVIGVPEAVPGGTLAYSFFGDSTCSGTPSSTQTVSLTAGAVPASAQTDQLGAGSYSFQAKYSGDSNYLSSSSSCEPFKVLKSQTSVSVSCTPDPATIGSATICDVTVTGYLPGGSVELTSSSATGTFSPITGECPLTAGGCSFTYADTTAGSPTITAGYPGDANNLPGSGTLTLAENYKACGSGTSGPSANLEYCNLAGVDMAGKNLAGANLHDANLQNANLNGANLKGADLSNTNAAGADFQGANLKGANLTSSDGSGANFARANLMGDSLRLGSFSGADFQGANMKGDNLSYGTFIGAQFQHSNLKGANMSYGDFDRANFTGANTKGANTTGASFVGTIDPPKAT